MSLSTQSATRNAQPSLNSALSTQHFVLFFAGLLIILILAAIPRLMSYDYSLPFVDYTNEPNKYLGAQEWRGLYDSGGYYDGYPPGYPAVHYVAQLLLESRGIVGMSPTVGALRLVSVFVDLLAIVFIALTARLAANGLAGILAALVWAAAPIVLENNVYALPDPMIALLAIIAVWLGANALIYPQRRYWAVWSVVAGLLATLLKYSAFPLVGVGGLAALILTARDRKNWRLIAWQVGIVALVMGWLFFVYGIDLNTVEREGATIREEGVGNILDFSRVAANLYGVLIPIPPKAFALAVPLGIVTYVVARRIGKERVRWDVLALCVLAIIGVAWLISAYTVVAANYRMRDVLPGTAAACVIFSAAVAQVIYVLPRNVRPIASLGVVALVVAFIVVPGAREGWRLVERREPPDRRVALRQWAEVNLDPGTVLVERQNDKTFNPIWSGLVGRKWFDWWTTDDFTRYTPQDWREIHGISYIVYTLDELDDIREDDPDYPEGILHLRDFEDSPGRGPRMSVYRTWLPEHAADVQYGESIRVVGYDGALDELAPGDTLTLRFYWQADDTPAANYSLFLHLTRPGDPTPLAQADGAPAAPERPTLTWDDSGETIIGQPFSLILPADLESGDYTLRVGLYDYTNGQRLPVITDGESAGDAWEMDISLAE